MTTNLQVRFPDTASDDGLVIDNHCLAESLTVDFENQATDSGKLYLLITGPDKCTIYGCLLTSPPPVDVPISQILVGILSCQHCSAVYRDGRTVQLCAALQSSSNSILLQQTQFSVSSPTNFIQSVADDSSVSSRLKLQSIVVCHIGSVSGARAIKLHLTGNSFSRDVLIPDAKFSGNIGRHIFSEEDRSHSQLVTNTLTLTARLAGSVSVDNNHRRRHSHQIISSATWSNLSLLLHFPAIRSFTFCHIIRPQSPNGSDKGCVVSLTFEAISAEINEGPSSNSLEPEAQPSHSRSNSARTSSSIANNDGPASHQPSASRLLGTGAMDTLPRLQRYPRVSAETPLPPGWEARLDSNGRMFFVDHVNRTTTWQRPQLNSSGESVSHQAHTAGGNSAAPNSRVLPPEDGRRSQSTQGNSQPQPPVSSTAAAAAVRQRDQFVRRNESFRRLIGSDGNNTHQHGPASNRYTRNSTSHAHGPIETGPPVDLRELMETPAVRFLTRPDLLTFLSQTDSGNSDMDAARALFNQSSVVRHIVKHIRRDPQRFVKYQHNRELVHFLCGMAEREKPLPTGWDVRMDESGRPFFLDHSHRTTTYIDPRLPLEQPTPQQNVPPGGNRLPGGSSALPGASIRNVTHRAQVVQRDAQSVPHSESNYEAPPIDYSDRVVAWLKLPETETMLASRYPPYRNSNSLADKVRRIIRHGRSALDHYSNDVHVAQMLSFFENDINSCGVPSASVISGSSSGLPPKHGSFDSDGRYDAFRTKVRNFYKKMASKGYGQGPAKLRLDIRRDHVLEDSFTLLTAASRRTLQKSRLIINFNTEDGLDYGGPQREFFFLVSRNLFNPYYGLFEYATSNSYAVHISPMSQYVDNAMQWYRFAGRVIALALIHQHLLDAFFTPTFYKLLLRRRPTLDDLEAEDPQFYQSLVYIRDTDITGVDLALTFSTTEDVGGRVVEHELKPGGRTMAVTERNKAEYIQLVVDWRIQRSIAPQARQLQAGFAELLDPKLIETFEARELELLIAGIPEIDLDDWRHNTEYRGGYHDGHPIIRWFWMAVERMDNDHRLRLLQFVTGTASLPYEGFAALRGAVGHARKFCIERWGSPDSLPRAHTCFNRLDLPPYPSFQTLFDKLVLAIDESQSFGIE